MPVEERQQQFLPHHDRQNSDEKFMDHCFSYYFGSLIIGLWLTNDGGQDEERCSYSLPSESMRKADMSMIILTWNITIIKT